MAPINQTLLLERCIELWPSNPGIALSPVQLGRLEMYLDELEKWNRKINLTGLRSRLRIVNELLLDSLLPIPYLPVEGMVLDVGSGAGFPSIPLKICSSGLFFHLVEPILKRTNFLRQVIRLTGLEGIEVFRGRLEDLDSAASGKRYDTVISRGLFLDAQILSCCAEHLTMEGLLFTFQGSSGQYDYERFVGEDGKYSLSVQESISYEVPGVLFHRRLVIYKKERK